VLVHHVLQILARQDALLVSSVPLEGIIDGTVQRHCQPRCEVPIDALELLAEPLVLSTFRSKVAEGVDYYVVRRTLLEGIERISVVIGQGIRDRVFVDGVLVKG